MGDDPNGTDGITLFTMCTDSDLYASWQIFQAIEPYFIIQMTALSEDFSKIYAIEIYRQNISAPNHFWFTEISLTYAEY